MVLKRYFDNIQYRTIVDLTLKIKTFYTSSTDMDAISILPLSFLEKGKKKLFKLHVC